VTAVLPYVERWIAYRAWRLRVPGVQYAVWFDGCVQLSGAVGSADLALGTPMTTQHLFRIASHSKTFTATAVLQLLERGLLRLDDRLEAHLPEVADMPSGIGRVTVRALLEHGGGVLRDGLDGDFWQHARPFPDADELLAMVRDDGVKVEADSRFDYSNLGYALLGRVVERLTGRPYAEAVHEAVVAPLGLASTHAELDPARADDYATGYSGLHTSLERRPVPHVDTAALAPATGFASTAEDVVRFLAALRVGSGELLDDSTKRLQQRRAWTTTPGTDRGYGMGLILEQVAGRAVWGHSGGYPGHITRSFVDPGDGIAVSVLTNAIDGPAHELSSGVLGILDAALHAPARRTLTAPGGVPGDTSAFEGRFAGAWGVVDVVRLGDRLVLTSPGGPDPVAGTSELEVVDARTLRVRDGDGFGSVGELVRYHRDDAGTTLRVRFGGGVTLWPWAVGEEHAPPWGGLR
jgi:CubicO group peptidase (beta-lactamase class C family)